MGAKQKGGQGSLAPTKSKYFSKRTETKIEIRHLQQSLTTRVLSKRADRVLSKGGQLELPPTRLEKNQQAHRNNKIVRDRESNNLLVYSRLGIRKSEF